VAKRLAGSVEHDREVIRLAVLYQSAQHGNDPAYGTGRLAARRAQIGQRMKRTIEVRRAVDQNELSHDSDEQDSGDDRPAVDVLDEWPGGVAGPRHYGRVCGR